MKTFRLLVLSNNTNSFGLRQAIMVTQEGEAWKIHSNDLNIPKKGRDYQVADYEFGRFGWECCEPMPDKPPLEVIRQAWPDAVEPAQAQQSVEPLIGKIAELRESTIDLMADLEADQHYDGLSVYCNPGVRSLCDRANRPTSVCDYSSGRKKSKVDLLLPQVCRILSTERSICYGTTRQNGGHAGRDTPLSGPSPATGRCEATTRQNEGTDPGGTNR